MATLFRGGGASKQAEAQRAAQRVANDRQMASAQAEEARQAKGATRKAPRGRRLFVTEQDGMPSTLGG